jgi:hypothetical protein
MTQNGKARIAHRAAGNSLWRPVPWLRSISRVLLLVAVLLAWAVFFASDVSTVVPRYFGFDNGSTGYLILAGVQAAVIFGLIAFVVELKLRLFEGLVNIVTGTAFAR